MTELRAAAQQALEQLKINRTNFRNGPSKSICKMLSGGNDDAIADLEAALVASKYDLSLLEATQEALRDCMAEIQRLRAALAEPSTEESLAVETVQEPVRCPLCNYQYGHQIGCENNPLDIALATTAQSRQPAEPVQEPIDRAAFERHAERLGYSVDPDTREGRKGGYWSSHTQLMWLTWKAALAEPQEPVAWLRVIDEAMVTYHLGVADPADDYETAKRKMNTLLSAAQDIGTYFAKQAEPVQGPVQEPMPTSDEDEAQVLARLSKTPAEAYERGYMDGHSRGVEAERERCARICDNLDVMSRDPMVCRGSAQECAEAIRAELAEPQNTDFERWWDNALDGPTPMAPISKETAQWIWNAAKAEPVQEPWEHLKQYGYAPGSYMSRCHACDKIASGVDKRAITCRPCAEARHAALSELVQDHFPDATKMVQEPFGYFRAEPFGWTDCAATDEGAIPLYTTPPQRPAEPVGIVSSLVKGGVVWQRWPADMPDGTRLFSEVQP